MSIYERGRQSCVNCEHIQKHGKVHRTFYLHEACWHFYRHCSWCGCCFPATVEEWNAENPDQQHVIPEPTQGVPDEAR